MKPRSHLNDALESLYREVLEMGRAVEQALQDAIRALADQDRALAKTVIKNDARIDEYEKSIEDSCIKIIALEQPVASDLRILITIIKIVSDLERIGDHARHLAKSLKKIDKASMDYLLPDIENMLKTGIKMLHKALRAFSDADVDLAETVAEMDSGLDKQHAVLHDKIINMMKNDLSAVQQGSVFLFLSRFLERLGDHVIIICDWIIYAKTGAHIHDS